MLIAIISGLLFEFLVKRGVLPDNPSTIELPANFRFWTEAKKRLATVDFTLFRSMLIAGLSESRMVLRWILFGVLLGYWNHPLQNYHRPLQPTVGVASQPPLLSKFTSMASVNHQY